MTQPYISKYVDGTDSDAQNAEMFASTVAHDDVTMGFLKWELFNRHCHTPLLYPGNRINSQLKCDQFNGVDVKWEVK